MTHCFNLGHKTSCLECAWSLWVWSVKECWSILGDSIQRKAGRLIGCCPYCSMHILVGSLTIGEGWKNWQEERSVEKPLVCIRHVPRELYRVETGRWMAESVPKGVAKRQHGQAWSKNFHSNKTVYTIYPLFCFSSGSTHWIRTSSDKSPESIFPHVIRKSFLFLKACRKASIISCVICTMTPSGIYVHSLSEVYINREIRSRHLGYVILIIKSDLSLTALTEILQACW